MYTGVLTVILAWAVLFRAVELLIYALVVGTCFQLFVVFYEEPHLRAEFGSEYEGYCRRVGRWLPRLRRRAASAVFVLLVSSTATQSVTPESPTPPAPAEGGPVYPDDEDVGGGARDVPWSTTIADSSEPGERLILTGLVFTAAGKAREGVTVYAYHTDAKGLYRGKPWGRPRLRGWARTNAEGRYEFHTIRPAPYPNRRNPAHIHMTIAVPGEVEWWIPELRFANDAFLGREDIAREAQRGTFASIRPLERQADGSLRCVRDIRLPQGW
jgi:protocatechuate 3,4-dioxygenase beta subunit